MKLRTTATALLTLLISAHASPALAFEYDEVDETSDRVSPEDAEEILNQSTTFDDPNSSELQQQTDAIFKNKGKWTFKFTLVKDDGTQIPLSEQGAKDLMIPASIEKMFPGYIGNKTLPESFTTSIVATLAPKTQKIKRTKKKITITKTPYLNHMLHESDAGEAETTFIKLGEAPATTKYITNDMSLTLPYGIKILDGSGLDIKNRMSAEFMNMYLTRIHSARDDYHEFKSLLAQPGDFGTLEDRMESLKGSVFAKTGSMPVTRVSSLSGYVETKLGTLVFTVMGYQYPWATKADRTTYPDCKSPTLARRSICISRQWIDQAVELHANWLNAQPNQPFNGDLSQ